MTGVETIVAPATPAGESALAVIRVSGSRAVSIATSLRRQSPPPRRAWHGDYRDVDGNLVDDVVCCFFPAPHSYTGEDVLEISSHGNPFIINKLLEDLRRRGCRMAQPGEFSRRAFLNGRIDLTQAEAVMEIIRARSDRALAAAQRQLRGDLGRRIDALTDRLLRASATIEAYIDFPEDDLPAEDRAAQLHELEGLLDEIGRLAATRRQGDLLRDGARVVLAGEPNAGKSSLLNRLAGYERAIVDGEPGTTRDFLEERIQLDGHCIRITDTAGLRAEAAGIERAGVNRALERIEQADIVILVVDVGRPSPALPEPMLGWLREKPVLLAVNKTDLPDRRFEGWPGWSPSEIVEISALSGDGLPALRARLGALLDRLTPDLQNGCLAVNARHWQALIEAREALKRAAGMLARSGANELVAGDLRHAVNALGEIVGRIDVERVLDRLFATFCIGK